MDSITYGDQYSWLIDVGEFLLALYLLFVPIYIYRRLGAMKITQEKLLAAVELQTQILANIFDRNLIPQIIPSEEEPPVE